MSAEPRPTAERLAISSEAPDQTLIERAAAAIRAGKLVAIPTETVYGLGCDAFNHEAVAAVFAAKERPHTDPLIVHVDGIDMLHTVVDGALPPLAATLADTFWPGPLTIIFAKGERVPDLVTSGLDSVAVRCPSHPVARAIITAAQTPVAAPSANIFSHVSPTSADHVFADLGTRCDMIVDSGRATAGLESTVVAIDGDEVVVLRHGAITVEALEAYGSVRTVDAAASTTTSPSPGNEDRHYSPRTPTLAVSPGTLGKATPDEIAALACEGVLYASCTGTPNLPLGWQFRSLGALAELDAVAHDLYDTLRSMDRTGVSLLVFELTGEVGLGRAIDDRITRAASSVVIPNATELAAAINAVG